MSPPDRPLERRIITSLFLDIVGSTELMTRLSPERLKRTLDQGFDEMSRLIVSHGGTVEKFIGDAVFAVFGVPVAHADDPLRALRAAVACGDWAERHADETRFRVRVGVETGEALVDLEAAEVERERMIVGHCVNLAARLQAAADPGEVFVGPTCYDATVDQAEFDAVGDLELKGIGSVPAWRLVRTLDVRRVAEPGFVGRDVELSTLRQAFDDACAGQSMLALLIAPPGQGKTRLARQFVAGLDGSHVVTARCRPGAEQGSLTALTQLLGDDGPGSVSPAALLVRLSDLFAEAADRDRVASALMHCAGIPGSPLPLPSNPVELQDEIFNGWRRYVGALASRSPVVMWVEDLHWAEPQLVRLIDRLTVGNDARLLVLGTARPEFQGTAALRPARNRVVVELEPLDADAARELARRAGAMDGASIERAAGNPLFIVELARSRRPSDGEIPVTLHAAIAARIDELPRADREILQRAAVAGETFDLRDVSLLTGHDPGEVSGVLGRLAHAGYINAVDGRYRFHHPLVHDVAYGRLPLAERMELHARYAQEGADPSDAQALAHHWWQALGEPDADWVWEGRTDTDVLRRHAYDAHLEAGRRHSARFAQERAVEVLHRGLKFASTPAATAEVERELGRAYARNAEGDAAWAHRMQSIEAFRAAGIEPPASLYAETAAIPVWNYAFTRTRQDEEVVQNLLAEGELVARRSGDTASLALLLVLGANYDGDLSRAAQALELVERSDDPMPHADTLARLAVLQMFGGQLATAGRTYERVERLLAAGAQVDELEYLAYRSMAELLLGRMEVAEGLSDEFLALSEAMGPHLRTHALQTSSSVAFMKGDWESVLRHGREVRQIATDNAETPYCIRGAMAAAQGAVAAVVADEREDAEALVRSSGAMIKPGSQRSYALYLPSVMLGTPADVTECLEPITGVTRPWQRQIVDPAYVNLALGLIIADELHAFPAVLDRLTRFGANGSRTAAALAESASAADPRPLEALGYRGLADLFSYRH